MPPEFATVVTPGFTPGNVTLKITQMIRNLKSAAVYNATGFQANIPDYQVQVRLFDSPPVPKLIGNSPILPLVNNWTSIFSELPLTWDVEVFPDKGKNSGATDIFPLTMWYGGQWFQTQPPLCSVGSYPSHANGIRQITCEFEPTI